MSMRSVRKGAKGRGRETYNRLEKQTRQRALQLNDHYRCIRDHLYLLLIEFPRRDGRKVESINVWNEPPARTASSVTFDANETPAINEVN